MSSNIIEKQNSLASKIEPVIRHTIFYMARILAVAVTIFFSAFILEGFSPEFGWVSGLSHALLALPILLATIIAFKHPKIGGVIFVALGIILLIILCRRGGVIIALIPLITGILFLVEGYALTNKVDKLKAN